MNDTWKHQKNVGYGIVAIGATIMVLGWLGKNYLFSGIGTCIAAAGIFGLSVMS